MTPAHSHTSRSPCIREPIVVALLPRSFIVIQKEIDPKTNVVELEVIDGQLNELLDNSAIYSRLISMDERDDNTALERAAHREPTRDLKRLFISILHLRRHRGQSLQSPSPERSHRRIRELCSERPDPT